MSEIPDHKGDEDDEMWGGFRTGIRRVVETTTWDSRHSVLFTTVKHIHDGPPRGTACPGSPRTERFSGPQILVPKPGVSLANRWLVATSRTDHIRALLFGGALTARTHPLAGLRRGKNSETKGKKKEM